MSKTLKEIVTQIGLPPNTQGGNLRDGLIAVIAISEDGEELWPVTVERDPKLVDILAAAYDLSAHVPAKFYDGEIAIRFGRHAQSKILVESFVGLTVVILFRSGHTISKSMKRVTRQAARRYGFERVESGSCSDSVQSDKQPAPLSAIRTGAFSQSQEVKTPVTGECPAVK